MKRIRKILFCYYSGTGNTKLITDQMSEVLRSRKIEITTIEITESTRITIPDNYTLGLSFPVAYQSTYPFIWNFFRNLPSVNETEVFMVDTLAGFSGGIVGPLKKLLLGKGYKPIGAKEIKMPINLGFYPEELTISSRSIVSGLNLAEIYAGDIISGKSKWNRVPVLSDLVFLVYKLVVLLVFSDWNQKYFKIRVSEELCSRCGLCVKSCPVGNIRFDEITLPVFEDRCEFCLRCLAVCPNDANSFRFNKTKKSYRAPEING